MSVSRRFDYDLDGFTPPLTAYFTPLTAVTFKH
jgi:hypothetical protein